MELEQKNNHLNQLKNESIVAIYRLMESPDRWIIKLEGGVMNTLYLTQTDTAIVIHTGINPKWRKDLVTTKDDSRLNFIKVLKILAELDLILWTWIDFSKVNYISANLCDTLEQVKLLKNGLVTEIDSTDDTYKRKIYSYFLRNRYNTLFKPASFEEFIHIDNVKITDKGYAQDYCEDWIRFSFKYHGIFEWYSKYNESLKLEQEPYIFDSYKNYL